MAEEIGIESEAGLLSLASVTETSFALEVALGKAGATVITTVDVHKHPTPIGPIALSGETSTVAENVMSGQGIETQISDPEIFPPPGA